MTFVSTKPFKPTSSEMMQVLRRIETEYQISDLRVKGVPLWPALRIRWFFSEWERFYAAQDPSCTSQDKIGKVWRKLLPWLKKVLDHRLLIPSKLEGHRPADIVFLSDGISFANLGNEWFERFCDPLIEQADRLGLACAMWSPLDTGKTATRSNIWSAQASLALGTLLAALVSKFDRCSAAENECTTSLIKKLQSLGFQAVQFSRSSLLSDAYRVRILSKIFQRRLVLVKPRLACVVSYYSLEGMSFVWACKQLGIPVIDLQHGVEGDCHPAYAGWKVSDLNGKAIPLVPDYFWVWSASEARVIRQWAGCSAHQPYVGGNPWADLWKRRDMPHPGFTRLFETGRMIALRAGGKPIVLVTLQYGLAYAEQLDPLKALLELAQNEYAFWVRLHPMMMQRRAEVRQYLKHHTVEMDEVSDLPLHALLPYCNLHITHSSSTVIEAADYGIPSLITSCFGAELFPDQMSTGIAVAVTGGPIETYITLKRVSPKQSSELPKETDRDHAPLKGLLQMIGLSTTGAS